MTDSDMIGKVVAHYRIDKVLGQGGMGAVYLATDLNLQRQVALKVMHPHLSGQEQFQKRFLQEARAAANLDHPGIVRILSFDHTEGVLLLVMELVPGGSLRDYIDAQRAQGKTIDYTLAVEYSRQIADALHYAHQQGMTHRDIKPDNILLKADSASPGGYRCLITDFGLAKLAESNVHSLSGVPMGTFAYMSPEQAEAEKVDNRADIYAMGIMLYELTVGKLPYQPRSITEAIRMHSREPLPKPGEQRPGFPADLERVIIKATQKSPNDRYQTAGDMSRDLGRLKSAGGSAPAASAAAPAAPPSPTFVVTPPPAASAAPPPAPASPPPAPVVSPPPVTPADAAYDRLLITGPDGATRALPLAKEVYIIGRDDDRDIVLPGGKVSRSHARLERAFDGKYRLIDLGSTNGTFVNEQRIPANAPESMPAGQRFRIGDFWMQIELANRAAADQFAQLSFTQLENQAAPQAAPPPPQAAPPGIPFQAPAPQPVPGWPAPPPPLQQPPVPQGGAFVPGGAYVPGQSQPAYPPPPAPPPQPAAAPYGSTPGYAGSQYGPPGSGYPGSMEQAAAEREQIVLTLLQTSVRIDAGSRMTLSLEVLNDSNLVDHFTIQVIGLDEDWYSPPPQTLYLMPKSRDTAQITFHPPRRPSSKAGAHPFEVRATARAQGLQSAAMQAVLQINPYHNYVSKIEPQRVKRRRGTVDLVVTNNGNAIATYDIGARDREELLNFKLAKKQFVLQPGEETHVPIELSAKNTIIIGSPTSIPFEVAIRPQDEGVSPQQHSGDLVNPPILPRWILGLFGISLAGILALGIGAVQSLIAQENARATATMAATINMATQTAAFFQTATPLAATAIAADDPDGDGLSTARELGLENPTNPDNPDTDGDGVSDGDELNAYRTDPLNRDSDGDRLTDGEEVNQYGTDPNKPDTDDDGVSDYVEVVENNTDPNIAATPTPTPQPTVDPAVGCVGGPPPQLRVGMNASVTKDGDPLRLRGEPSLDGNVLLQMNENSRVRVIGGPVCDDEASLTWWNVSTQGGTEGWAAEGELPDTYFLAPVTPAPAGGG